MKPSTSGMSLSQEDIPFVNIKAFLEMGEKINRKSCWFLKIFQN